MESVSIQEFNGHRIATAVSDTGSGSIVVFCHGFMSSSIGPNRYFVQAARLLADAGISSIRFDQYGCGNSEGQSLESSFDDWVKTATEIAAVHLDRSLKVGLFGQSMGASAAILVAANLPEVSGVVAWVPDPNVDEPGLPLDGIAEENGQVVRNLFWVESHSAGVATRLHDARCPMYIVQCTADEYVDEENRRAIAVNALHHHRVDTFVGHSHSRWTVAQAHEIMSRSLTQMKSFLA